MPAQLAGPLVLVGCGKMGSALLAGWRAGGLPSEEAFVVEPAPALRAAVEKAQQVRVFAAADALPAGLAPRAVVFAVKPQVLDSVLADYAPLMQGDAVALSIAAGKPIAAFEATFGASTPVVRAMPNTPAAVGRGITVLCANGAAAASHIALCTELMRAVGDVEQVTDEELMHAVTAVSGSGPAYVFLLIEAMAAAGVRAGLPEDLAARLARATVCGSGALASGSPEPADQLRRNVTSPGGTTAAALEVLMAGDGLQPLMDRAIAAAAARSRALA